MGVIQVAQALHVEHHDMAQVGQAGARLKGFVELFVILNKQHARIRVGTQVGHLFSGIGRVDTAAHATTAKDRQISEYPIGIGVGQDGYTLFGLETQSKQAMTNRCDFVGHFRPCPAVPDTQLFLA